MKTRKRICAVLLSVLAAAMLLTPAAGASAVAEVKGSAALRLEGPAAGLELWIYRIGSVYEDGHCELIAELKDYDPLVSGKTWAEVAEALGQVIDGIAAAEGWTPVARVTAGADGSAVAEDLPAGLYLITCRNLVESGGYTYQINPSLVSLPANTADDMTAAGYSVTARLKYTASPVTETVDRRVVKVWDGSGSVARPQSVQVYLLRDGQFYDSVTLSQFTGWAYTWEDLPGDSIWGIYEPGSGIYTPTVTADGISFVLVNYTGDHTVEEEKPPPEEPPPEEPPPGDEITTEQEENPTEIPEEDIPLYFPPGEPDAPEEPLEDIPDDDIPLARLPQTGVLWWPVPLLVMCGLLLMVLGRLVERRAHGDEEKRG